MPSTGPADLGSAALQGRWVEVGASSPRSSTSFLSESTSPRIVYHHCRRLRRARDKLLARPACLVCLLAALTLSLAFFAAETWWWYTRRWPGLPERDVAEAPVIVQQRFEQLGCYPLVDGDSGGQQHATTEGVYDSTCMRPRSGGRCRSGLPFYTFTVALDHVVSWRLCAEFCLMKGLDVSGVVDAVECRCGATKNNGDVWYESHLGSTRADLAWQPRQSSVGKQDPRCSILAARYLGPLPIPRQELDLNDKDLAYVKSVILGRNITYITDAKQPQTLAPNFELKPEMQVDPTEESGFIEAWLENSDDKRASEKPMDKPFRHCFPHQCAAGLPWPIRTTYVNGIPYAFAEDVSESTMAAFRAAVMAYHAATCIPFSEVSVSYKDEYKILVKDDEEGCFTSPVGYPILYRQDTEINLGWCNTERQIGNMIHELGHAMGMAHEHMRPDRDKYVHINYDGMTPIMQAQYAKDESAYTGSFENGPAPYDYGSLMHYPATEQMRTKPIVNGRGVHDAETGQRRGLSVEDVRQLRDMYQCDKKASELCIDMDVEIGSAIKVRGSPASCFKVRQYCDDPKFGVEVSYFCPRTCNKCPTEGRQTAHSAVHGCKDVNAFCERYKAYCPSGSIVGNEQWMAENCRKTCKIRKHCARGNHHNGGTPAAEADSEIPPVLACMDSSQTGLMNALGQMESCAGLKDRCRDPVVGGRVRQSCPASCGLCRAGFEDNGTGQSAKPMPDTQTLYISFVIADSGHNLAVPEQAEQFESVFGATLRDLLHYNVTVTIQTRPDCSSQCFQGDAQVSGSCCNIPRHGCTIQCEELRGTLSRFDAEELTEQLAGRGFAGVTVEKLQASASMDHLFSILFSLDWLVRFVICLGVTACVCLCFAITKARCFNHGSARRRFRHASELEADLVDSDDESVTEA